MKNVRFARKILGVEIKRNRLASLMFLSQKKYLIMVPDTYKMLHSKPVLTPLAAHFRLNNLQRQKKK